MGPIAAAGPQDPAGTVIPLPAKDRKELEKYLGTGVIGEAVAAVPIAHAVEFYGLREATWHGTVGKKSGKDPIQMKVSRAESGSDAQWHAEVETTLRTLATTDEGHLYVTSEIDNDHSVISRFTPHEPHLLSGMKPGESQTMDIDVKVYDLNHPDHLAHKGNLHLTFSYIGAYKVTVPAGTYEAVLIKWEYKGKVGPAKIQDTQYRFVAEGVGPVAFVDKKSISAMLVYHDDSRRGFLLHKVE
jgi:hypothetical protein